MSDLQYSIDTLGAIARALSHCRNRSQKHPNKNGCKKFKTILSKPPAGGQGSRSTFRGFQDSFPSGRLERVFPTEIHSSFLNFPS